MATNTTNYNFKKPDESDFYSVQDQNNNWDKADATLKDLDTPTFEDYSGSTTVPDAATAIGNIKSKGKLSTTISNIKAAFKGVCLIGQIVNNCVTNNSKLPLSAAQGKELMDLYTVLNSNLAAEYALAGTTFVTDFNNASIPGRYRVYNASGTAAHGPYAGSVGGYVDILTDGDTAVTGTKVYQELHDHNGDTYTRINIAGTSYGAWEHYTQDSDLGGNLQLRSKLYTGSAASGIVVTSRNNPISLENVSGQILAHVDSNQIGYVSTCPTNPVTFTVANGRVKMYVDNNLIGYLTTTTT